MTKCICFALQIVLSVVTCQAQANALSAKKVHGLRIEQFGSYRALAEVSQEAGIPIGVDAVQPAKETAIAFDFAGGTAADLLNLFTSHAPDYKWVETKTGVIHVMRSNHHVSLLDVVIHYPGAEKKTRQEVWESLAHTPEISAWMSAANCTRSELFQGREFAEHNKPISVAPGDVTVAQLLDDVAVKSGENYWAVLQSFHEEQCFVDIILW